ncbi:MAG: hypothetical protein MJ252_00475 [archaeon]|nr:hypothetical protein [archaeon]
MFGEKTEEDDLSSHETVDNQYLDDKVNDVKGLQKRIYDEGRGLEFNKLLTNPKQIKAMKVLITEDDEEEIVKVPMEENDESMEKTNFDKTSKADNTQDKLSITGFKIIERLPPTGGETQTSANKMIDRFKVSSYKSDASSMSKTKSRFNIPLEPKLSRPTTTITNQTVRDMYAVNKKKSEPVALKTVITKDLYGREIKSKEKEKEDKIIEEPDKENQEEKEETKGREENEEDQFMNQIHQFIRKAFEERDSKMDFVYFLPSNNENFYDLRVKDFDKVVNKKHYYTLSSKGLTVYIDKKVKLYLINLL